MQYNSKGISLILKLFNLSPSIKYNNKLTDESTITEGPTLPFNKLFSLLMLIILKLSSLSPSKTHNGVMVGLIMSFSDFAICAESEIEEHNKSKVIIF
jgi:hypothetical protein